MAFDIGTGLGLGLVPGFGNGDGAWSEKVSDWASNIDPTTDSGLVNLIGGGILGGATGKPEEWRYKLSGEAAKDEMDEAAEDAEEVQQEIVGIYQQQLDTFKEMTAPYQEVGESFLPELQSMLSESGRADFMESALQSQEFQNIAGAATDQLISNSAALGNRLSSGIQEDVLSTTGSLASQYAANAYSDRLNQLGQGVNIGLGTLGGSLSALQSSTAGQANAMGNIANINLQNANAQAAMGNPFMGLLGAGAGALLTGGSPLGAQIGYQAGSSV